MGQEGDQGGNQNVPGNKWKWTHNNPKLMGHSKGSPEREGGSLQYRPTLKR